MTPLFLYLNMIYGYLKKIDCGVGSKNSRMNLISL